MRADPVTVDLADVTAAEQALLDLRTRADPIAVAQLLHPEFLEFGASGRVWDRASISRALSASPDVLGHVQDLTAQVLAPDVVLVTYRLAADPRADAAAPGTLRSSVWVRAEPGRPAAAPPEPLDAQGAGWRLRFHQGTPSAQA
jgi:ribonuclease HI